jgi:hypothetical protein
VTIERFDATVVAYSAPAEPHITPAFRTARDAPYPAVGAQSDPSASVPIGAPWSSRTGSFGVVFCAEKTVQRTRVQDVSRWLVPRPRGLALRAVLALGAIVEYPTSECGFEQRLAARDHAHGVHDVAAFDLFEHVAGRARQD